MNLKSEFWQVYGQKKINYDAKAIITVDGKLYPIGTDTKVLSSVFELIIRPAIYELATRNGLVVQEARSQNYYPDFTLMRNESDLAKIAVDVKTTYCERDDEKVKFTLGSYTSFIQEGNETKNIEFPYSHYVEHWIVGFIYKRKTPEELPAHIYDLKDLSRIPSPFEDVSIFIAQKWKIAGDKAGSGNTTNIGSISGTLADFENEAGSFTSKEEFLEYWRSYGRTANERSKLYKNLEEFRRLKESAKKSK